MRQFIKLIVIRFLFYHSFGQVKLWINKHFKEPAHLVSIVVISNEAEANMPVRLLTFAESRRKMGVGGNYRAGDREKRILRGEGEEASVKLRCPLGVWLLICPLSMIKQLCHLIVNCLWGSVLLPQSQSYMYRIRRLCRSRLKSKESLPAKAGMWSACVHMRTCRRHCPATASHCKLVCRSSCTH